MKATELRSGNYMNLDSKLPDSKYNYFVSSITQYTADLIILGADLQRANCTSCQLTDLSPIPLTEEWLIKFELTENHLSAPYSRKYDLRDKRIVISIADNGEHAINFEGNTLTHVSYVHQLQNLYYAFDN